jgi:hypothetical protein
MNHARLTLPALLASVLLLGGCGGGGSDGPSTTPPPTTGPEAPSTFSLQGVAASGAPLAGASIEVRDASGAVVASTTADAQGSYTLVVPLTAKAPFVVSASTADVTLFSPVASAGDGTVNVTPITTVIAAQLSPTGDPAQLSAQLQAGSAIFDSAKVASVVAGVTQALQPLLDNAGASIDPISGTFVADGTGYDRVLNAVNVTIRTGAATSEITISVKAAPADGSQPPEISFTSDSTPPPLPPSAASAPLPPPSLDAMLAAFATQVQDCMAVPLADRVTGTAASDTVSAPACRAIFFNDDPAAYKDGRAGVRTDWPVLFSSSLTNMKVSPPVLRLLNPDGTMLVSWSNTATTGDVLFLRSVLTTQNGALKAIGNQDSFGFRVRPWSETRDFLNTPALSYRDTGFSIVVDNAVDGSGASVFDRVEVTIPTGQVVVLKPQAGLSFMSVVKRDGTLSGTSVLRLASRFFDSNRTTQARTLTNENIFWADNPAGVNTDWTDAEVAAINNLGRWKAAFFKAGNKGTVPDLTQFTTTTVRAFTPSEIVQQPFPTLSDDLRSSLTTASANTGSVALAEGSHISVAGPAGGAGWVVPAGALPPVNIQAQGFVAGTGARWNDNLLVPPSARSATIACTRQTALDAHCSAGTGDTYSSVARLNLVQLFGNDINDMQWTSSNALFKVQQP